MRIVFDWASLTEVTLEYLNKHGTYTREEFCLANC